MISPLFNLAISAGLSAVLIWCAVSDIRTRRIPNLAVLGVIALYGLSLIGGAADALLPALAAAGIALIACFCLYSFRIVGAGDAKLFIALSLFAGLKLLAFLALATALAGGLMVVALLVVQPRRILLLITTRGQLGQSKGLPYGVAIALGGLLVRWGSQTGYLDIVSAA